MQCGLPYRGRSHQLIGQPLSEAWIESARGASASGRRTVADYPDSSACSPIESITLCSCLAMKLSTSSRETIPNSIPC